MALHVGHPGRAARVGDLGPMVVPHTTMGVDNVGNNEIDRLIQDRVRGVGLGDANPMGEVGADLHLLADVRILEKKIAGRPGGMQESLAMGLVRDREPFVDDGRMLRNQYSLVK